MLNKVNPSGNSKLEESRRSLQGDEEYSHEGPFC
jgi:hypothetical protein